MLEQWVLANSLSIQMDGEGEVWHAGRCVDILALGQGNIIVATDTGGVWLIDGAYNAIPQSDTWHSPDMECLAFGPLGPNHLLAGARGGLFETDPEQSDLSSIPPKLVWRAVDLPTTVQTVHRIVAMHPDPRTRVLKGSVPRLVVMATDAGVWWGLSDGPGSYVWKQAIGVAADDFYGLAVTSVGVIVGVGMPSLGATGLYYGTWGKGDLVLSACSYGPPHIMRLPGIDVTKMRQVSVASCRDHPERVYAIAADGNGQILYILASSDGGMKWSKCNTRFTPGYHGHDEFFTFFGSASAGGWHKTISVHAENPDVVAFAWLRACISLDGGSTWRPLGGDWNPSDKDNWDYSTSAAGLHEDTHTVYFDTTFTKERIYVLSDGGVAENEHFSDFKGPFKSSPNRNLANLQFLSPQTKRDFWGTLGIAPFTMVIGGGLQDNGNVWCRFDPTSPPTPWFMAEGGDGGWVTFVDANQHQMLTRTNDQPDNNPTHHFVWDTQHNRFDYKDKLPVLSRFGWIDPAGLKNAIAEAVPEPRVQSLKTLYAVGAGQVIARAILKPAKERPFEGLDQDIDNPILFGLFADAANGELQWEEISSLPDDSGSITAVGPDTHGEFTFVGTADGRMFKIDTARRSVTEHGVEAPEQGRGQINRIVSDGDNRAFAMMDSGGGSYVLRLESSARDRRSLLLRPEWVLLRSDAPLPYMLLFALDINRGNGDATLAVASDTAVWVSPDLGDNWFNCSNGLPAVPHCSDLRFRNDGERTTLFLSTYGRSVWMADVTSR